MTVENILTIYKMATPEEKRDGVVWYAKALAECTRISLDYDIPLHTTVGVIAALSPNNKWAINIQNCKDMIKAFVNGDGIDSFRVCTYHKMKQKAWSILEANTDHEGVIKILNGQKIVSFYRNIMGDDTCTIDGHARNIAYAERVNLTDIKTSIGKKEYSNLQMEYVQAAKRTRVNGRALKAFELQAITWVVWRRIHGIK
tara:strand:- start:2316 stop:2915 length:600 start_codon:yes stop_codon:yes gene_type:complete